MGHLTEDLLAECLEILFYGYEIIRNEPLKDFKSKFRPDFYIPEKKLIVEFDGFKHYSDTKTILRDKRKDKFYHKCRLNVVRIPYFIQPTADVNYFLFGERIDLSLDEGHGFVNGKALLPADYVPAGIYRFIEDLMVFYFVFDDIKKTLQKKIKQLGIERVLPKILYPIVENDFSAKNLYKVRNKISNVI